MAVLKGTAKPAVDLTGRSPAADDLTVTFEPHFTAGITHQESALGLREQRAQVQAFIDTRQVFLLP